jgi:hypothetical protein
MKRWKLPPDPDKGIILVELSPKGILPEVYIRDTRKLIANNRHMNRLATNISLFGPWFLFIWYLEGVCNPDFIINHVWLVPLFLALSVLGAFTGILLQKSLSLWSPVKLKLYITFCLLLAAAFMQLNLIWLVVISGFFLGLTYCFISVSFIPVALTVALAALCSGMIDFFNMQGHLPYFYLAATVLIIPGIWASRPVLSFGMKQEAGARLVGASWVKVLTGIMLFSLIFWAFNFIIWQHIILNTQLNKTFSTLILIMATGVLFPVSYLAAGKIKGENALASTFWFSFCWMIAGGYTAYAFELSWMIMLALTAVLFGLVSGTILRSPHYNAYRALEKHHVIMGLAAVIIHFFWVYWNFNFAEKLDLMKMPKNFHLLSLGQMMLKQINVFPAIVVIASGILFVKYQK